MDDKIITNGEEFATEINEEVVADNKLGKGLLVVAAVGAAIGVGTILYKKVIAPQIAKAKAKKALEAQSKLSDDSLSDIPEYDEDSTEN